MTVPRSFTVVAYDSTFAKLGTIDAYESLELHPRFNAVGAWQLTYPQGSMGAQLLGAKTRIAVFRRGSTDPVITGPVLAVGEALDETRESPMLTFSGPCDNIWLAARAAYPVPTSALTSQTSAFDVRSGVGETVMKAYVNLNAGPGALTARQVPGLGIETDTSRGGSVAYSARFDTLLALLQALGVTAGLGFKVQQVGSGLVFSVYIPVDRSKLVRFSRKTKSLGAYAFSLTGPTGTTAIVGDKGTGTGRVFAEFTDTTAESDWGIRYEVFVDQSNTLDTTQVAQGGQQALDSGSPQAQVSFTPIDTDQRSYGIDYGLGDTVTAQVDTSTVVDVVREVAITDDTTAGIKVAATVGGSQASDPASTPAIYKAFRALATALGLLQKRR